MVYYDKKNDIQTAANNRFENSHIHFCKWLKVIEVQIGASILSITNIMNSMFDSIEPKMMDRQ